MIQQAFDIFDTFNNVERPVQTPQQHRTIESVEGMLRQREETAEFTVMCSCSPQNFEFGFFTLLFCRGWQTPWQNNQCTYATATTMPHYIIGIMSKNNRSARAF